MMVALMMVAVVVMVLEAMWMVTTDGDVDGLTSL